MIQSPCRPPNCGKFPSQPFGTICTPTSSRGDRIVCCSVSPHACVGLYGLHTTLLRRSATVMRKRSDVLDPHDFKTGILDLQNRLLATRAWALHFHFDFEHAVLAGFVGGLFSG